MAAINLLPTDLAPKSAYVKLASNLRVLAFVGTVIFLLGLLGMVAVYIINQGELNASLTKQERLKTSIRSLEKTEQQYVLLKSRAQDISKINEKGDVVDDVEMIEFLLSTVSGIADFTSAEISEKDVEFSLVVGSSKNLAQTFASIISLDKYSTIALSSFSFASSGGYNISVVMQE
jgi:hypothetical protein